MLERSPYKKLIETVRDHEPEMSDIERAILSASLGG